MARHSRSAFVRTVTVGLVSGGLTAVTLVAAPAASASTCSGGTISYNSGFAQVAWETSATGTNCTATWSIPSEVTSVEVIAVAGGGGSGFTDANGGGGGGGAGEATQPNSIVVAPGASVGISVGAGGVAATSAGVDGTNGQDSALTIAGSTVAFARGGGGGGSANRAGLSGGSGGGGGGGTTPGAAGTATAVSPGAGFDGAAGAIGAGAAGGGGGGGGSAASGQSSGTYFGGSLRPLLGGKPAFGGNGGPTQARETGIGTGGSAAEVSGVGDAGFDGGVAIQWAVTAPGAPTGVSATAGDTTALVTWTAPTVTGAAPLADYEVAYSSNNGSNWSSTTSVGSAATSFTVTGLTNGTDYLFRVRALNDATVAFAAAESSWDTMTSGSAVTPSSGLNPPATVSGTTGTTSGSLVVTWTPPSSGTAPTTYQVQYSTNGTSWTTASGATSSPATITGLTPGAAYYLRVASSNGSAFGPPTQAWGTTTAYAPPAPGPAPAPAPSAIPTPTPTASASATPVASPTPTPGGTVLPTGPLAPNLPGSNPAIPATGLPLGGSVLLVNGQPQALTVRPSMLPGESSSSGTPTALSIEGPGFSMSIAGLGSSGRPLGLTPDGALILEADRRAAVEGSGFQPNTDVELYLFSEPRYIGKVTTNATGGFKDVVPLPIDVPAGRHTLQSNGFTADGQVRSVSLGVQLEDPSSMSARRPATAKTTVYFAPLSSVLDKADKAKLRSLVRKSGLKATKVQIVGYVQKGGASTNDQALSLARAQAVASYVRSLGLKGAYVVKGGGVASVPGAKARNARVTIRFVR